MLPNTFLVGAVIVVSCVALCIPLATQWQLKQRLAAEHALLMRCVAHTQLLDCASRGRASVESVEVEVASGILIEAFRSPVHPCSTWMQSPVFFSACLQLLTASSLEHWSGWTAVRIVGSVATLFAIGVGVHLRRGCRVVSACCACALLSEFASPTACCVGAVCAWRVPGFPASDDTLEALELFHRENGRPPKRNKDPSRKAENSLAQRFNLVIRRREKQLQLSRLQSGTVDNAGAGASSNQSVSTVPGDESKNPQGLLSGDKVTKNEHGHTDHIGVPSFPASDDALEAVELFHRENGRLPKRNKDPARKSENNLSRRCHHLLHVRDTLPVEKQLRLGRLEETESASAGVAQHATSGVEVRKRLRCKTPVVDDACAISQLAISQCGSLPAAKKLRPPMLDATCPSAEASSAQMPKSRGDGEPPKQNLDLADAPEDMASPCHFFEPQDGAWCGMHALNNYMGGPYVQKDDCRRAARRVVAALSQMGLGDVEDMDQHLDPQTGFLSIDVINVLGAATLGIHVEANDTNWLDLRHDPHGAVLLNWNQKHWSVLRCLGDIDTWLHLDSTERQGPRTMAVEDVLELLGFIHSRYGAVFIHRINAAEPGVGNHLLEREGLRAMVSLDVAEEVPALAVPVDVVDAEGAPPLESTMSLVTVNVDGLGEYATSPAWRMAEILRQVAPLEPDILLFQEVVMEMYEVLLSELASWKIHRRRGASEIYFNVTAVRSPPSSANDKTTSFAFPTSNNGRHVLTVRRDGWAIVNVHAESGRASADRDERI